VVYRLIEKVLKAEKEVDFETRLKLENAVREINDKEILNQWIKFTESKTEDEAQNNIKNLLDLLVDKIQTK
jgi:CRISPR/Cas system endoribonuclease Cas6 (RAMP superfamily)